MEEIDFKSIEQKWQKEWENKKIFQASENKSKKKFYCLEMYPYPSSSGLHMGHAFNYTIGDIFARFKRMQGFNVLYPMGYDSFGLPAENAAIKANSHPKIFTEKAIANYIKQQKQLGLSYDWSRMLYSHDINYYKWNQYFFLKFLEKGLAYRKMSAVNFCKKCNSVLANEQVHNGKCWRHSDTEIEIKQLEQWFIKTTEYAEELLNDIESLNWPERIKLMQKNWIGKSEGIEINFKINNKNWPIFTTRPDTIYGVTFMVISAQHPSLMKLVAKEKKEEVDKFLKKLKSVSEKGLEEMEKQGVFTGSYAINPINNEKIPVYAGNFVVADYGCGMVMAVPAHDQRDFEFAKKYKIPVKVVIEPNTYKLNADKMSRAFTSEGTLINSEKFNNISSKEAISIISNHIEKNKFGKRIVQYKLRDWLISRQRYWGTPIPVVYCKKCGIVPIPYEQLPVILPEKVKFGKGNPLTTNKEFVDTVCPKCKGKAKRETDTMDTFFDSSWYYLRYCDNKNDKQPFNINKAKFWMPVDFYVGGAEHACMHLIYARFFTKALRDLGFVSLDEPFPRLFNQGMLHKDGVVMSKSKGNVVLPEEVSEKYGIDTARLFLMSIASPDKDIEWSDEGINGSSKFVKKIFNYVENFKNGKDNEKILSKLNSSIKIITDYIENLNYNLAVIEIRNLFEKLEQEKPSKKTIESFLKLLSPFCPHICEELWHRLGNKTFISLESWPQADESKINPELEKQEQIIENTISDIHNILKIIKEKQNKQPKKVYLHVIPKELSFFAESKTQIESSINLPLEIFSVSDKNKKDPENKASKAKPGKPAIFIE